MERRLLGRPSRGKPAEAEAWGGKRGVQGREGRRERDSAVKSNTRGQSDQSGLGKPAPMSISDTPLFQGIGGLPIPTVMIYPIGVYFWVHPL